uniref:Fibronectin type-III domain-containing protein n=2 Tax=Hanusia phi TaxID=3032 RepID=A0A7S0DWM5_9CRYP|mmetsp:Transcript_11875/g.27412  ORF Transcript_11875/g.27412 Transcript_11875/m.27412 type:complete len:2877 (+) Transcript_11875:86-8716(+)|eukprot:160177-Hanusia_phi.AAC.1
MQHQQGNNLSLTVLKTLNEFDKEISVLTKLFRKQNGLVSNVNKSSSREHSHSVLYLKAVGVIEAYRPPRLPAEVFYPRLVKFGDEFSKVQEYRLASASCYQKYLKMSDLLSGIRPESNYSEQISLSVRSKFGVISCSFYLLMESDPQLCKLESVRSILRLLDEARTLCEQVSEWKEAYWLVYNSTITIFTLCRPLLTFGYCSVAIEYLLFASLSMEAQVPLNQAKYLSWRVRLYTAVCYAYEEEKMRDEALQWAERGLAEVKKLQQIEDIDPVPPPASIRRMISSAEAKMMTCVYRCKATDGETVVNELLGVLSNSLPETTIAVIEMLRSTERRTIRHLPPTEEEATKVATLNALHNHMRHVLDTITRFGMDGGGNGVAQDEAPISEEQYQKVCQEVSVDMTIELMKFAYNFELKDVFESFLKVCEQRSQHETCSGLQLAQIRLLRALSSLEHPQPSESGAAIELPPNTQQHEKVWRKLSGLATVTSVLNELPIETSELSSNNLDGADLFADAALLAWNHVNSLLQLADSTDPEDMEEPPPIPRPAEQTGTVKFQPASEKGEDHQAEDGTEEVEVQPGDQQGEKEDEGAAETEKATEGAEEAVTEPQPRRPVLGPSLRQLATDILRGISKTLGWVRFDDAVLVANLCLRLANLFEKRNRREDAVNALQQGIEMLYRTRTELLLINQPSGTDWTDLHALPSIRISTDFRGTDYKALTALEQALAYLQVDLLHALYRNILHMAIDDYRKVYAAREASHAHSRLQRTKDQNILGTKSRKQINEEIRQAKADKLRPLVPPPSREQEILAACNKNCYEKAIVLIEMARLHRKSAEREQLLLQAIEFLEQASLEEERLEKQVRKGPSSQRTRVPPPPRLLMRSATQMILTADAWMQTKGDERTVFSYALYCKEEGSGVAVSLNNVECHGSGIPRGAGESFRVTGLQPNETYVFAVAALDEGGRAIEGIGETSLPVAAVLPLPLLQIWSHIALSAWEMGLTKIGISSSRKLYHVFVHEGPLVRSWEQSALSQDTLVFEALDRAPPPLLRSFAIVLSNLAHCSLSKLAGDPSKEEQTASLDEDRLRLRACKKVIMGIYVSMSIRDESLACRAVMQLYHAVIPLLKKKTKHDSIGQTLLLAWTAVRMMTSRLQETHAEGHQHETQLSVVSVSVRRVMSCLKYSLLQFVSDLQEPELMKEIVLSEVSQQLWLRSQSDASLSREDQALWEYLLVLEPVREKLVELKDKVTSAEVTIYPLLVGNPEAAKEAISEDEARFLELTYRVVHQAMAEKKLESLKQWIQEAFTRAQEERKKFVSSAPVAPERTPLPPLDPTEDEMKEEQADKEEERADSARQKDLELQFLTPSEAEVEEWEQKKNSRKEREDRRRENAESRLASRREAAANRIAKLLLARIRFCREHRQVRRLLKDHVPWLAALRFEHGQVLYDECMRLESEDTELDDKDEETPGTSAKDEQGEGEGKADVQALDPSDPAYVKKPNLPRHLRGPFAALKSFTQAVNLASRGKIWTLMLNSCMQSLNVVKEFFSDEDSRVYISHLLREIAESIVKMITEQDNLCRGVPSTDLTFTEKQAFMPPHNLRSYRFSDGVIYRVYGGILTAGDVFDVNAVSRLLIVCLESLMISERWVAIINIISQLHLLINNMENLMDKLVKLMLTACKQVLQANEETNRLRVLLSEKNNRLNHLKKETGPKGRLAEGLRTKAKERSQAMKDIEDITAEISDLTDRISSLRFVAIQKLPGGDVTIRAIYDDWVKIQSDIGRDKSKHAIELERCRMALKSFMREERLKRSKNVRKKNTEEVPPNDAEQKDTANENGEAEVPETSSTPSDRVRLDEEAEKDAESKVKAGAIEQQYGRCISTLREKREKELLPLALQEYGEILYFCGKTREAGLAWNDALDSIFTIMNVGRHWRDLVPPLLLTNPPAKAKSSPILNTYGLNNILLATVLCFKLSSLTYRLDLHMQLEYSLFAAHLIALTFSCGLPHPARAREFADYTPRELTISDPFADDSSMCDAATLADASSFCCQVLFEYKFYLQVLPLASFYQWLAKEKIKDPASYANACAWKARACVHVGAMPEAINLLVNAFTGVGLPSVLSAGQSSSPGDSPLSFLKSAFKVDELQSYPQNDKEIRMLAELKLSNNLQSLYPDTVKFVLELVKIELIVTFCGLRPFWPQQEESLLELCSLSEELLADLRQVYMSHLPGAEGSGESQGEDLTTSSVNQALSFTAECDLIKCELMMNRGLYSSALDITSQLCKLLDKKETTQTFLTKISIDPKVWLRIRSVRCEALFKQSRWTFLRQECNRVLQEMARLNDQVILRDVMTYQAMQDLHQGKVDLCLATLEEIVNKATKLAYADLGLAKLYASLADVQRELGQMKPALQSIRLAEAIMHDHFASLGLAEVRNKYTRGAFELVKVKILRADLEMEAHDLDKNTLDATVQLCNEAETLMSGLSYVSDRTIFKLHFLRARAKRHLFSLDSGQFTWGGICKSDEAEGEARDELGQPTLYDDIISDLKSALLHASRDSFDFDRIRSILLEAVTLNGALIASSNQQTYLRRSIRLLKLACEISARNHTLQALLKEESQGSGEDPPAFLVKELEESLDERKRSPSYWAYENEHAEERQLRGMIYFLLSQVKEQRFYLFDNDHAGLRISKIHNYLIKSFPPYADACAPIEEDQLLQEQAPEEGLVVLQWYKTANGIKHDTKDTISLLCAICPGTEQTSKECYVLSVQVDNNWARAFSQQIALARWQRDEDDLGPGPARSEWEVSVYPSLGRLELQGEEADARKKSDLDHLMVLTNKDIRVNVGGYLPETENPSGEESNSFTVHDIDVVDNWFNGPGVAMTNERMSTIFAYTLRSKIDEHVRRIKT